MISPRFPIVFISLPKLSYRNVIFSPFGLVTLFTPLRGLHVYVVTREDGKAFIFDKTENGGVGE